MRSTAKTLVIISPGFPRDEAETTCMPSQQLLIKSINRNFPEVKIIILALYYPEFKTEYNWYGNKVISFNGRNKEKIYRLLTWIKVWRKLLQIKRQENIIGILSFWSTESAVIGKYFGKYHGIKHFTWLLGQDAKKDNKYIKFYKPTPDSLIAISDKLAAEFYKNHGIKPKHIIYNGIEINLFQETEFVRNIDILGAGSLIPLKQFNVFIETVADLKNDFPDINTKICGGGTEEENLRSQIKNLKLEDNVVLTGTLQHNETLILMQQTKVFLHTSLYEGFSTACLEALYAGAHVVSFCYPLNAATKNWHVVKTREEMTRKVKEILTDKNTKYERVMLHSMDDTARKIMQLFN